MDFRCFSALPHPASRDFDHPNDRAVPVSPNLSSLGTYLFHAQAPYISDIGNCSPLKTNHPLGSQPPEYHRPDSKAVDLLTSSTEGAAKSHDKSYVVWLFPRRNPLVYKPLWYYPDCNRLCSHQNQRSPRFPAPGTATHVKPSSDPLVL